MVSRINGLVLIVLISIILAGCSGSGEKSSSDRRKELKKSKLGRDVMVACWDDNAQTAFDKKVDISLDSLLRINRSWNVGVQSVQKYTDSVSRGSSDPYATSEDLEKKKQRRQESILDAIDSFYTEWITSVDEYLCIKDTIGCSRYNADVQYASAGSSKREIKYVPRPPKYHKYGYSGLNLNKNKLYKIDFKAKRGYVRNNRFIQDTIWYWHAGGKFDLPLELAKEIDVVDKIGFLESIYRVSKSPPNRLSGLDISCPQFQLVASIWTIESDTVWRWSASALDD